MIPWGGISCFLGAAALYLLGRSSGRYADVLRSVPRVNQLKELGASGFALTVRSEWFEESGRSLVQGTLDYLRGLKMLRVRRIERVLPTGTSLTVVGEAVKDFSGTVWIQRPSKGPFYVSPKTIDELILHLGTLARWCKHASPGLTVFGAFLIAKHTIQHIDERRCHRQLRSRVLAAAAKRSGQENEGSNGNAENGSDGGNVECPIPDLCAICLEQEYNAVFLPCGHMCCCTTCCLRLKNCPLCRRQIERVVKICF